MKSEPCGVFLVLKKIGINGPRDNPVTTSKAFDFIRALHAIGTVPQDVQGYCRANACQQVNLSSIAEFLLGRGAAAGWINFPNRVPVLAKPQDGNSMRKLSSALNIFSLLYVSIRGLSVKVRRH